MAENLLSRRIFLKQAGAGALATLALKLGDDLVTYTERPRRL